MTGFFGMEDTIQRVVSYFQHAAQGLEERKQVLYLLGPVGGGKSSLAERLKALIETQPIYVLAVGDELSPVFESPLGLFRPDTMGAMLERQYKIPARRADRRLLPLGDQAARRTRRRHLQVLRRQALPVAAEADRRRQDRTRRREQPGHLRAGRQGRHPQARELLAARPRRLQLFGRPQPHDAGAARIRRNVQGADQGAAPAADGDAGRQLRGHREPRRAALSGRHPRPFQRIGMGAVQEQQEQRSVPRPHLRGQGALLPARDRRGADLPQAAGRQRSRRRHLRAGGAGDSRALLRAVAPEGAPELADLFEDARLQRRQSEGHRSRRRSRFRNIARPPASPKA